MNPDKMKEDLDEEYDIFMRESKSTAGKSSALEFAKGQIIRYSENLRSENAANTKIIEGLKLGSNALRADNADLELKANHWNISFGKMRDAYYRQKAIWEKFVAFKEKEKIEYNGADTGFMNGQAVMWNKFKNKIGELESVSSEVKK